MKKGNGEEENEPGGGVLSYVNIVLEGGDEGHEEEAQGKSLEKRGRHQEKGSNTNFGMAWLLFIFCSISLF